MSDEAATTKETILLVHGTFAAPVEGKLQWYQRSQGQGADSTFVAKLDAALERHGSSARCWAHCNDAHLPFHWSGRNNWIDRTSTATLLTSELDNLASQNWKCHVIAHSHGGNALAEAIPQTSFSNGEKLVTLGTPFLDTLTPVSRTLRERSKAGAILNWSFFATLSAAYFVVAIYFAFFTDIPLDQKLFIASTMVGFPLVLLVLRGFWSRQNKKRIANRKSKRELLCISSAHDEAWQLLHHLRSTKDPLASPHGLWTHLRHHRRVLYQSMCEIDRLHGAREAKDLTPIARSNVSLGVLLAVLALVFVLAVPVFRNHIGVPLTALFAVAIAIASHAFIAFMAGFTFGRETFSASYALPRAIWRRARTLKSIPSAWGAYIARRRARALLQTSVMGLDGYEYELPAVQKTPLWAGDVEFAYEDLPPEALKRALKRREAWIASNLGVASDALAQTVITSADLSALLEKVEQDMSLVHAAYYTDDECIDRISRWIAGKG